MSGRKLAALIIGCALLTTVAEAAFYRYQDAAGRTVFVDDLDKVPEAFKNTVQVYPEAVDTMTDKQREVFDAEDARRQHDQRQRYLEHLREIEAKSDSSAAAEKDAPVTTRVRVINNQVLVPVKMGYGGMETEAVLLLDTGANITTIHQEVATPLGLRWPKRATMQVVGGRRIRAGMATLEYITLGTLRLKNIDIGIIEHEGAKLPFAGLLGMNVLRRVEFQVDLKNQRIIWKRRSDSDAK
ncbi:MAG: retroviral-like aspartic protease family protein [Pseudomonadota bacterium]